MFRRKNIVAIRRINKFLRISVRIKERASGIKRMKVSKVGTWQYYARNKFHTHFPSSPAITLLVVFPAYLRC